MCEYYRRFSVRNANFIDTFRDLLTNNAIFKWTDSHTKAFQSLKQNFVNSVTLSHYLSGVRFRVDASDVGISGLLYQIDDDNNPKINALVSRVLSKTERHYRTTEKELLAVIYAVMKFRIYSMCNE